MRELRIFLLRPVGRRRKRRIWIRKRITIGSMKRSRMAFPAYLLRPPDNAS
jgi:hypothetical protein